MEYFQLPQNKKRDLFTGPETKGSNKLFIIIGLLGFIGLVGSGLSWFAKNSDKKSNDLKLPVVSSPATSGQPSPKKSGSAPVLTQIPRPSGTSGAILQPRLFEKKVELNRAILNDVTDTYNKDSKSLPIEELTQVEHGPLLNVVEYVMSHTQEEIEKDLTIPHPEKHPKVTFTDMITKPGDVRGAVVKIGGRVRMFGYSPYSPEFQKASGVEGFWYGYLFDKDNHQYAFRLLEDGQKFKTLQSDEDAKNEAYTIELTGVFLKKIWIQNKQGQAENRALYSIMPLIIAKTASDYVPPRVNPLSLEAILFLIFGSILVLTLGFVLSKEMRSNIRQRKYSTKPQNKTKTENVQPEDKEVKSSESDPADSGGDNKESEEKD